MVKTFSKVCLLWKFCPYTKKEPTLEEFKYLAKAYRLRLAVDFYISLLKHAIQKQANVIENIYESDLKLKLSEEKEMKEKEKYFNDFLHLFYPRIFLNS